MKFYIILALISPLFGDLIPQRVFNLYQNGNYHEACQIGFSKIPQYRANESFITLVGFSCLKDDKIDQLGAFLPHLNQTADARTNNAFFSMILMQKTLLMQSIYDQKPIKNLRFPSSSHPLSKIFVMYMQDPQNHTNLKEYRDPATPRQHYKLYPIEVQGRKSIALDEYYDNILTVHHVY